MSFVSDCCKGESCHIIGCENPAGAKVAEEIFHDDPFQNRHPLTAYICAIHFRVIMGGHGVNLVESMRSSVDCRCGLFVGACPLHDHDYRADADAEKAIAADSATREYVASVPKGVIESSHIISDPGASVKVTEFVLSPEAKAGLNIGDADLSAFVSSQKEVISRFIKASKSVASLQPAVHSNTQDEADRWAEFYTALHAAEDLL